MAVDMFLSITDLTDDKGTPRPGTVVIDGVAYVQISDFSFSVANPGAVIVEVSAGQSQLQLNPVTVTLAVDVLTPLLLVSVEQGTSHPRATIIVRDSGLNPPVTTQQYEFAEVGVRSLAVAGSPGGDQQTAILAYARLQVTFTPVSGQGKAEPPITAELSFAPGAVG
jgi:type VI protein secretion system component Hcp